MGEIEKKDEEKAENDNTIIQLCLEIVREEYQKECDKKASLENRAGLVMALLGVVTAYLLETVPPRDIWLLTEAFPSILINIKFFAGLIVYGADFFALFMLLQILRAKSHDNFEVSALTNEFIKESQEQGMYVIKNAYCEIIKKRRVQNNHEAQKFNQALSAFLVAMAAMVVYLLIP